jgi:hypothetical protein
VVLAFSTFVTRVFVSVMTSPGFGVTSLGFGVTPPVAVTGVSLTGSVSSSPISVISMTEVDVCKCRSTVFVIGTVRFGLAVSVRQKCLRIRKKTEEEEFLCFFFV